MKWSKNIFTKSGIKSLPFFLNLKMFFENREFAKNILKTLIQESTLISGINESNVICKKNREKSYSFSEKLTKKVYSTGRNDFDLT